MDVHPLSPRPYPDTLEDNAYPDDLHVRKISRVSVSSWMDMHFISPVS